MALCSSPTRLADGSLALLVQVCLGDRKKDYRPPRKPSNPDASTQVMFRSDDEGRHWRFRGVVADPRDYPESVEGTDGEMALVQTVDGTLTVVTRADGDCGCQDGGYSECGLAQPRSRIMWRAC